MVHHKEYYKNSNTGEMKVKQYWTETQIKNMPTYYYDILGNKIEDSNLVGFVPISEKKFLKEREKLKKLK
jgi:hypothetical protein